MLFRGVSENFGDFWSDVADLRFSHFLRTYGICGFAYETKKSPLHGRRSCISICSQLAKHLSVYVTTRPAPILQQWSPSPDTFFPIYERTFMYGVCTRKLHRCCGIISIIIMYPNDKIVMKKIAPFENCRHEMFENVRIVWVFNIGEARCYFFFCTASLDLCGTHFYPPCRPALCSVYVLVA